jgi:hypothetical protein
MEDNPPTVIAVHIDPRSDRGTFRAVGMTIEASLAGGSSTGGFMDLRPFPYESETKENLTAVIMAMAMALLENAIPLEPRSRAKPVPEIIIATDRGPTHMQPAIFWGGK